MMLENKVAVITGASSGIGKAAALALAKEGSDVLITFRNNIKGALKVKNEINALNRKCEILKVDLENINNIKMIIDKTIKVFSRIDILVNNAGDCNSAEFLNDTIDNLEYLLSVDVKSVFLLSQLAAKEMIKRGQGSIINITSISGVYINDKRLISYCTAKAAANMLTKGMAKALAEYGIRVNAILPGVIDTPLTWKAIPGESKDFLKESILNKTPLKKIGLPNEIAEMVKFLASDKSKFMTGSLVVIDGGLIL